MPRHGIHQETRESRTNQLAVVLGMKLLTGTDGDAKWDGKREERKVGRGKVEAHSGTIAKRVSSALRLRLNTAGDIRRPGDIRGGEVRERGRGSRGGRRDDLERENHWWPALPCRSQKSIL